MSLKQNTKTLTPLINQANTVGWYLDGLQSDLVKYPGYTDSDAKEVLKHAKVILNDLIKKIDGLIEK